MPADTNIKKFLSHYDEQVYKNAMAIRKIILANLPGIIEQLDLPAKMIAYCYGQKYIEMLCVIIPSKNGIKLGFYKGTELPDPVNLLKGTGKLSRYVEIKNGEHIPSAAVVELLANALAAYRLRMAAIKNKAT